MLIEDFNADLDQSNLPAGLHMGQDVTLAFLRSLNDCVKLVGIDGRLKFMNENGLCAMELPELDKVRGHLWWDLWPESTREVLQSAVASASEGKMVRFEEDCPTAAGTWKRWEVTVAPLREEDSSIINLLAISREVPQN